jgi:hypothetical protein
MESEGAPLLPGSDC